LGLDAYSLTRLLRRGGFIKDGHVLERLDDEQSQIDNLLLKHRVLTPAERKTAERVFFSVSHNDSGQRRCFRCRVIMQQQQNRKLPGKSD
jgi:hypothetical protein